MNKTLNFLLLLLTFLLALTFLFYEEQKSGDQGDGSMTYNC